MYDASCVTFPPYPQTDAQVRAVLTGTGLDLDGLSTALTKRQRGVALSTADVRLIPSAMATLPELIPAESRRSAAYYAALFRLERESVRN
jgi:hypothetical protein